MKVVIAEQAIAHSQVTPNMCSEGERERAMESARACGRVQERVVRE